LQNTVLTGFRNFKASFLWALRAGGDTFQAGNQLGSQPPDFEGLELSSVCFQYGLEGQRLNGVV
jgi:hypothetical protein